MLGGAAAALARGGVQAALATDAHRGVLLGDPQECKVLHDWFGLVIQGVLFAATMGSLLLKWKLEKPQRKFWIFLLDSSKQIVGAGVIHCLNMAFAMLFGQLNHGGVDECSWYWVNIMIDTTLGVLICYGLLKASEKLLGYDSGKYGKGSQTGIDWETNPDYKTWGQQIAVWCVIVCLMKCIVVLIMWVGVVFWAWLSGAATHAFSSDPKTRLILVMVITPLIMNFFQFWVTDSFLKYKKAFEQDAAAKESAKDAEAAPLASGASASA